MVKKTKSMVKEEKPAGADVNARILSLKPEHQEPTKRFAKELEAVVKEGLLNQKQADIVLNHVLRLGERGRNPANTGNVHDLFFYTLRDTKDPLRALAQLLADSIKIVPMPEDAELIPPLRDVREGENNGKIYHHIGELFLNPGQKMLCCHTNIAYSDSEQAETARAMIKATFPRARIAKKEQLFWRMVAQSQHMPSSSFVLAAVRGLSFEIREIFEKAGYSEAEISSAEKFFVISSHFSPAWLGPFVNALPRTDAAYLAWLKEYQEARSGLPEELKYQLMTDTLTNFCPGTMASGKWVDSVVAFSGVKTMEELPAAIAKVVNQYMAEFIDLQCEPAERFITTVKPLVADFGIIFDKKRSLFAASGKEPKRAKEMAIQLERALNKQAAKK